MPCKTFVLSVFIDLRSAERVCSYYGSGSQTVVRVPLVVREDLQGGMRRGLLCVFLHKIHRCSFYLSGSVNKFLKGHRVRTKNVKMQLSRSRVCKLF